MCTSSMLTDHSNTVMTTPLQLDATDTTITSMIAGNLSTLLVSTLLTPGGL
jgi:hypothetical protein